MRRKLLLAFVGLILMAACGNETEEGMNDTTNNSIQPINYETPQEQKERINNQEKTIGELGGYPQSEQEYVNEGDKNLAAENEDRFTSERTLQISEYLSERKEIVQAQVAETDDRIIVAIMTGNKYYPNLADNIEEEVKQIVSDKEIVVYSESTWWDRRRNLNSNPNPTQLEEEVENNINDFYGNE
ncbi:YhcN/YlaJ family sporulation lipoprotein [Ornithinibacillus massiliensis]|uniref:YhcN/YlaJ family sporulation lipoprotein n=1 Tax=Ornithinibacillus massiliensis TaxID=1944633 RepID=A0ABS5MAY2_9BACI|nr:YhcN/YlaJ family sporulation lipoprotein [Ornithinibacillus massiliensis]MBS3679463.1 YhcN/YlaJ family sporulation lipoprotein [Ornithinibacillus massiliensis]